MSQWEGLDEKEPIEHYWQAFNVVAGAASGIVQINFDIPVINNMLITEIQGTAMRFSPTTPAMNALSSFLTISSTPASPILPEPQSGIVFTNGLSGVNLSLDFPPSMPPLKVNVLLSASVLYSFACSTFQPALAVGETIQLTLSFKYKLL